MFQEHLSEVLATLDRHSRSARILEVGCGKGALLDQLRTHGHDAWGVDSAYEGDSPYVTKAPFEPGLGIRGEAIVMRHVLEHIPQPMRFLETIRRANGEQGTVYIEVPCLEWILRKRAWFDVFYEHVNYSRLSDQDKFLAASRLPVLAPNDALRKMARGAAVFVMNSNYLDEIRAMAGPDFNYIPVDGT